jgi:scyllo-inositol 2-dehydrogenase (NADP+)
MITKIKEMRMEPLRVAAIGAGWVTLHRHIPSLLAQPGVQIIGIVDRKADRACDASKSFQTKYWSNNISLSDIPWFAEVDAVTIGTSPFSHHALACKALSLGKHVLTEKPFAMTPDQGRDMIAAAKKANRILAIVHNFQFSRSCQALIRDMQNGCFGDIVGIEAMQLSNPRRRLPTWYDQLPGGLFFDESPHLLYLIRYLGGGTPKVLSAFAEKDHRFSSTPAFLTAHFASPTGIPVRLTLNFVSPVSEWHILVCGEKGLGCIDLFRDIYVRLPNDGLHVAATVFRTSFLATWQHWLGHVIPGFLHLRGKSMYGNLEVMRRFTNACLSNSEPEGISSKDGLEVLCLQHEILSRCQLL